jgi:group I intron endonuclease
MDPQSRPITIYRHVHRETQRCYVGQTVNGVAHRWVSHVWLASHGATKSRFHEAIREHGPTAFDHEVLETVLTRQEANEAEQWWIAHFGSDDRVLGYNLEAGGGVGKTVHPDTRAKLSAGCRQREAAKPLEQRLAWGRKLAESLTQEQRSARARKGHEAKSFEDHSVMFKRLWADKTQEERSEAGAKRWSNKSQEQRAEHSRRLSEGRAALSPEKRTETTRKGWATRRANSARKEAA